MKKIFFNLLVIFVRQICFAQEYYVDIHENKITGENDAYLITFAAYPSNPYSAMGHIFVNWREETLSGIHQLGSFGFYPKQDAMIGVVYGFNQGSVLREPENDKEMVTKAVTFRVDKNQFQKTLAVKDAWLTQPPNYSLLSTNCISFIQDIGQSIGIFMPERGILSSTPSSYMDLFIQTLEQSKLKTSDNTEIKVFDNGDYEFGNESERINIADNTPLFTGRKRTTFSNGVVIEGDYTRSQISGPKCTWYPSGQVWYQDDSEDSPISVLRYENGNILSDYDPSEAKQKGYLRIKNGDIYLGESINGVPINKGELWGADKTYYQGIFEQGVITTYSPIKLGNVIYYGPFKDNLPDGKGEIKFPDGSSYSGSLSKGKFSGSGKFISPDNGILNGVFSEGICQIGTYTFPNGNYFKIDKINRTVFDQRIYNPKGELIRAEHIDHERPERNLRVTEIDFVNGIERGHYTNSEGKEVDFEREHPKSELDISLGGNN